MEELNNVTVQENETAAEPKKKKLKIKLDRAEKFMIIAVLVAQGLVPFATSFIKMLFSNIGSGITNLYSDGYIEYTFYNIIYTVFNDITSAIYLVLTSVLSLTAVIIIAYLAFKHKKLKNAAAFLGVYFVAQNIFNIFVDRPVSYVLNFIVNTLNSLAYSIASLANDGEMFNAVTALTDFAGSSLMFVVDFVCLILTAVLAIIFLRIMNGKIKIKFKKKNKKDKAAEETTEEVQENA